jgi:hypothetical protein
MPTKIIYVALLDEGTDCWRPVDAVQLNKDTYRIVNPPIEDERWQFESGDVVHCRERVFADGELLLEAFELASSD